VEHDQKICNSSKNQQIFLTNPENGEPLTSSESAEEINNYLLDLTKDYVKISDDHLITGPSLTKPLVYPGHQWKKNCPIPKVKPCRETENVRPIAITSIFSKIQESYALEWMLDDAKDRQFGGLPGSSPVLALLEMFHMWFGEPQHRYSHSFPRFLKGIRPH
jgi:hypothetical protein